MTSELNAWTSFVLKFGTFAGVGLMVSGLAVWAAGLGNLVLFGGILVLIFTPFAGVVASTVILQKEGERRWVATGITLMSVIVLGILFTVFFG